jgi:hypothetical protein
MKIPIDVTTYHQSLVEDLTSGEDYYKLLYNFDIIDRNKFESIFADITLATALENYSNHGYPHLTYDQFEADMQLAVTDYHLESLQEKGLIESFIDPEDMELKYKTTNKGLVKSLTNNICLN